MVKAGRQLAVAFRQIMVLVLMASQDGISYCPDNCSKSLGISDYRIRDEQMSVNSAYNNDFATFGAHRARLNLTSWPPGYRANKQGEGFFSWLAVNLDHDMVITGIATQGYGNSSVQEWVESYIIYYEKGNDVKFFTEADGLSQKIFSGNRNSHSIQYNEVPFPVVTRRVTINPKEIKNNFALRMELYGCKPEFYFVAWIAVSKSRFTLEFAERENEVYLALKKEVTEEIMQLMAHAPGFLSAELRTLSPQKSVDWPITAAEIRIFCLQSKMYSVAEYLRKRIQRGDSSFFSEYLNTEDHFDCQCTLPRVTVELSKTLKNASIVYVNEPFHLKATFRDDCNTSNDYKLYWEVCKCDEYTGLCDQVIPYGRSWSPDRPKTLFPRLFRGVGYLYIRCVFKRMTDKIKKQFEQVKTYDYGYVRLEFPPLVAIISGPARAVKGNQTFVILDASESYDPDKKYEKIEGMSLNWLCTEQGQEEPTKSTEKIQTSGCYNFTGKLNNSSPLLRVDLKNVKGNRTYVFQVVIRKGQRISRAVSKLKVDEPFILTIGCITNCGAQVSASQRFTLKTSCSGLLCHHIINYKWVLFQLSNDRDWEEIPNFEENILTHLDSPNLVIPGGKQVLRESNEYKVMVIMTLDTGFVTSEEMRFVTNSPPHVFDGRDGCFVTPSEGFVFTTEFNISCSGWMDSDLPLNYEFRYQTSSGVLLISSGPSSSATARLPLGRITLEARVSDSVGVSNVRQLQVQVVPVLANDISKALESSQSGGESQLQELVNSGQVDEAAQMAYTLLTAVVGADVDTNNKQAFKKTIVEQISTVEVDSIQQVTQLSAVVVMATEGEKDIPATSQENVVGLLDNMTDFLLRSGISSKDHDVELFQNVGESLLQGMSNSLTISSTKASLKRRQGDGMLDESENDDSVAETERKANEHISKKVLNLINKLGATLLATKVVDEKPSVYHTDKLEMILDRQRPAKISGKTLGKSREKVTLPSAEDLFGPDSTHLPSVDAQMTTFNNNPFTWASSAKSIRSSVVEFNLKKNDGTIIEVSGLSYPVELFLPVTRSREDSNKRADEIYFVKPSNGTNNLRYHRINIPTMDVIVFVEIKPELGQFVTVFVSAGKKPTPSEYQYKRRIPDFSSCSETNQSTRNHTCKKNPYEVTLSSDVTGKTGAHYVGIMFTTNETQEDRIRVARSCGSKGGRHKRSCISVKDPPTTPPPTPKIIVPYYNANTDVNYTMSAKVTSCLYWSEKKQDWINDGCSIGPKTSYGVLHCMCTHLSAFGGDLFVAPNPIDFDEVWTQLNVLGETGNYVVLATVCSIFGFYFLGLVLARRADRTDERKVVGNVYLSDCSSLNGFVYKLHVQTGMWNNQGTTASVGVVLYGEDGCSGPISLSDPKARRVLFARGSVTSFTLSLPYSLGRLFKIRIWHDNSGDNPAWFLQQVEVQNANSGDKWHFLVNRWLALEKGSGEIELEINAADKEELEKFKNIFLFRTARSLGDGHLWLSVLTRPPHISFTRCQRLSCCLSVLFSAMVTNAMFYNFGVTPKDFFQLGPLKLSWTQIKIGIQSSLLAIPINVLIVTIFRNTKQKSQEHVYKISVEETEQKAPGCLPHIFIFIGWLLCLVTSLTAAAFTVFYSMMWGADTSNQWLTSITVSFIQDVFVSQPVKVILLVSLLSLIVRKTPELEKVFGVSFQKGEEYNKTIARPPQGEQLAKAKDFRAKVQGMYKVLAEVMCSLIFVVLLMIICYGNRGTMRFMLTSSMEDMFVDFKVKEGNISTFWNWTQLRLLPALYDTDWYNGRKFDYKEGFVGNRELFMVGMPRLRQIRMKPANHCQVAEEIPSLGGTFSRCIPPYSAENEYKARYSLPGWLPVTNTTFFQSLFDLQKLCPKPWRYLTSSELQTLSYQGFYSIYDGGGFVADLGYNLKSALNVVNKLKGSNWIDEFSVAVFVEFTVFNPSSSFFSIIRCLYERLPTGGKAFSKSVKTLTLYKSPSGNFQMFYEVCQLLFIVIILLFVTKEIFKVYNQKKKYFTDLWNWIELLQIATAICVVVMFFMKAKYTSSFVKKVRNNPFETSSADYIVLWSTVEAYVLSFLTFIVTIKFLRVIRFNRHVCQMIGTLARSLNPLVSFFIVFMAATLAYAQLAFLLFGSTLDQYSSFFSSLRAVLQMLLGGKIFFYELKSADGLLGPLFVFLYTFTMTMILLNMFIAILNESYIEVMEYPEKDFTNADLGEFIIAYIGRNLRIFGKRISSFLKTHFQRNDSSRKQENERWITQENRRSSETERLILLEDETDKIAQTACPLASIESLRDIECTLDELPAESNLDTLQDSENATISLLSLDEQHESKEDENLHVILQDVKGVINCMEFISGFRPLRPIKESVV